MCKEWPRSSLAALPLALIHSIEDQWGLKGQRDHKDYLGSKEKSDQKDQKDQWGRKENKDLKEHLACRVQ